MTEKQKCPLCGANVINLSRHLVLHHNIKNSDHLKSKITRPLTPKKFDQGREIKLQPLKTPGEEHLKANIIRPLTQKKVDHGSEKKLQPLKTPEKSNRKNIITTALKLRNEKVARTKIRHIERMGRLIIGSNEETVIINEGIDALLSCLKHQSKRVRDQALFELENILSDSKYDSEIKTKIRSNIE